MNGTVEKLLEKAIEKAEAIQAAAKRFELARTSKEVLGEDATKLNVKIKLCNQDEECLFLLEPPKEKTKKIMEFLKEIYDEELKEVEGLVKDLMSEMPKEHRERKNSCRKSTIAKGATNEEIKKLANQGLTHKQIADMTGMKANTVSHRLAYINKNNGVVRRQQKAKTYTKGLISDAELEEMYFRQGLTVKKIAEKYNVNPAGLYKRTEALKDKRLQVAKECASFK